MHSSALDGDEWLASRSGSFNPKERISVPTVNGLGGPKTGLELAEQKAILSSRAQSSQHTE